MLKGFDSVAELRENELRCAASTLGIKEVHFLNYRDSGMPGSADNTHPNALAAQDVQKVAAEVVHYIRLLQPQIVVTFDPIGGYRHPDHIAIQRATEKAFHAAGDPNYNDRSPAAVRTGKVVFQYHAQDHSKTWRILDASEWKDPRKAGKMVILTWYPSPIPASRSML